MLASLLFEAFTGLGAVLACVLVAAAFVCDTGTQADPRHEWTLRLRTRSPKPKS